MSTSDDAEPPLPPRAAEDRRPGAMADADLRLCHLLGIALSSESSLSLFPRQWKRGGGEVTALLQGAK